MYEYSVQQEQLSKPIRIPVPGEATPCVKETSSSLKDSSLDQSQTSSPVSVLRRRSYSSVRKKARKCARSENGRFAKSNLCEAFQSSPFDETADPSLGKQPRIKKVSDLLQTNGSDKRANQTVSSPEQGLEKSSSSEQGNPEDPNYYPKPSRKRKHPKMTVKKCAHCESTKTPQWREGPMGHGTLCNACGVKYKHGRLSQDYRPLNSPTFNPSLHSNIKPDAKSKGRKKDAKKCMHCKSTPSPWWEVPIVEATASTDYCPPNPPTLNPCLDSIPKLEQQSPTTSMQDSIPEPQQQQSPRISKRDSIPEPQQQPSPKISKQDSIPKLQQQQQSPRIRKQDSIPKPQQLQSPRVSTQDSILERQQQQQQQSPRISIQDSIPELTPKKQRKTTGKKKCMHCESTKTPQWREGPLGQGTLCNACGVQFRYGRLFPEYRPLKSPTYNPSLHSHLPKKVQQMRMKRNTNESAASGDHM